MATLARTAARTRYGVDLAVYTVNAVADLYKYITDASMSVNTGTASGRAAKDLDLSAVGLASGCTIDGSKIVVSTGLPMMAIALSATPYFTAVIRHAATGNSYTVTSPGTFLLTSAKLSASTGVVSESFSAVLQGILAGTSPTAATPAARTDLSATQYGANLASLAIGSDDYVNLFDSVDIDVSIGTASEGAVLDAWNWPVQTERKITINASRMVESPASAGASLFWTNLAIARAAVSVSVGICSLAFAGTFIITDAKWALGGVSGAQKETITLESTGAVTLS
jgi:hypothetical protein